MPEDSPRQPGQKKHRPLLFALGMSALCGGILAAPFVVSWWSGRGVEVRAQTRPIWKVPDAARGWSRSPLVAFSHQPGEAAGALVLAAPDGKSERLRVRRFEVASGQFAEADIVAPLPPLDAVESSAAMSAEYEFLGLSEDGRLAGVSRRLIFAGWTPAGPPGAPPNSIAAPTARQLKSAKSRGTRLDVAWFDLETGQLRAAHRLSFAPRGQAYLREPSLYSFCDGREWTLLARHSWRARAAGPLRQPPHSGPSSGPPLGPPGYDELNVWVPLLTTERRRVRGNALRWRRVQLAPNENRWPRSLAWRDGGRERWGIENDGPAPHAPLHTRIRFVLRELMSGRTRALHVPRAQAIPPAPIRDSADTSSNEYRFGWSRLAFSRTGDVAAATAWSEGHCFLFVWNWKSGLLLWRRDLPSFYGVNLVFSPDGRALALSGSDERPSTFPFQQPGRLLVFDVRDGATRLDAEPRSPEQQREAPRAVLAARLREARSRALNQDPVWPGSLPGDSGTPFRVTWSLDSRALAARYGDDSLQLWRVPAW